MSSFLGFDKTGVSFTVDADPIKQQRQRVFEPSQCLQYHRRNAVSSKGIVCVDLDGDGNDELCVCSLGGELAIYKINTDNSEWKCCVYPEKLGSITSVICGDIRNDSQESLIILSAEGKGYVFEWVVDNLKKPEEIARGDHTPSNLTPDYYIFPILHFDVPYNISAALVYEIDDDVQLIIGTTDRKVHSFLLYEDELRPTHVWNVKEQVVSLCGSSEVSSSLIQSSLEYPIIVAGLQGGIYAKISLHTGLTGVSYFGSTQTNQEFLLRENTPESDTIEDEQANSFSFGGSMFSYASRAPQKSTSLTMVAGPLKLPDASNAIVCGNFEGMLSVQKEKEILWDIFVGHPVFAVRLVDITGNGQKDIIAACWDGMVFICDYERNIVSFQCLEDSICAFSSGMITRNNKESYILVFVSLSKNIYVYSDLSVQSLYVPPLISSMKTSFASTDISKDWTRAERIKFIESCCRYPWSETQANEKLAELRKEWSDLQNKLD